MIVFMWINTVEGITVLIFLMLGIYLSSYIGLFGTLLNFTERTIKFPLLISAPTFWVSTEYLRSHAGFMALPWSLIGHSQYLNLPILQISSLTGVYGISFLIVMVNVMFYKIILSLFDRRSNPGSVRTFPVRDIIITSLAIILSTAYGFIIISERGQEETIPVTVIQGNIPQQIKWDPEWRKRNIEKHIRLSKESAFSQKSSLIVWPETSVTIPLNAYFYAMKVIPELSKDLDTYLLIGGSQSPKFGSGEFKMTHNFNTAFLFSPDGRFKGKYQKIYLLPFGEYLPYENVLPWPRGFRRLIDETGTVIPGKEYTLLELDRVLFGALICWENIFSDLFRQFVKRGARFMVNLTNEAWFGDTAAPTQFLAMNVFRAAENRVSIVRSANTGISCFINPYGQIMGKIEKDGRDIFVEGYLTMAIPLSKGTTFYTRYGDIFTYVNMLISLSFIAVSLFRLKISKSPE